MPLGNEYLFSSDNENRGAAPSVRVRMRALQIPPIRDAAIVGRLASVSPEVLSKTLRLLNREPFVAFKIRDDVISAIFVRKGILRKISWARLKAIVMKNIKPLMAQTEILALNLEIEIALGDSF